MSLKQMQALDTASEVKQEPVAMREALKKLARFLDVVRVYAQEIRPIHELETDKPLHWKAREIQDEVIRLINTIPQQEPIHWIAPNFEFLFSSTPQRTWVGLTDEEISAIAFNSGDEESAIHAAMDLLKEKNT